MDKAGMSTGWAYFLLLVIGVTGALGDVWIYQWVRTNRGIWLWSASVVWLASLLLFGLFLKWDTRSFTAAFVLSSVFHVLLVGITDYWYFGGRMNSMEWVGVGLGLLSIVVLEVGRDENSGQSADEPVEAATALSRENAE